MHIKKVYLTLDKRVINVKVPFFVLVHVTSRQLVGVAQNPSDVCISSTVLAAWGSITKEAHEATL